MRTGCPTASGPSVRSLRAPLCFWAIALLLWWMPGFSRGARAGSWSACCGIGMRRARSASTCLSEGRVYREDRRFDRPH
jgi:hypothetical protein